MQDDERGHEAGKTCRPYPWHERHADGRQQQSDCDQREPSMATGTAIRKGARPRNQQEQQHVVDRHHDADRRPPIAEDVLHERGNKCAE
jgi:hypothetical protein